ncbi:MAG TPA: TetR/AcrR family transcriptional regulator [Candidatus Eisenbacteria bacterium]
MPDRGRREHRKHVTRRDLLAAGRRLFGEKGLYDSRIEDLTRRAGIAKGTLYGYFANKEELIEAVVSSGFSELLGYAQREAQGARTHTDVIARLVQAHLAFFDENPDLMRVFHQVRGLLKSNRAEWRSLRRVLERYLAGLAHVLASNHPARSGSRRERLEVAGLLFGAVSGIVSVRASLAGPAARVSPSRATVRALAACILAFEAPFPGGRPSRRTRA